MGRLEIKLISPSLALSRTCRHDLHPLIRIRVSKLLRVMIPNTAAHHIYWQSKIATENTLEFFFPTKLRVILKEVVPKFKSYKQNINNLKLLQLLKLEEI